MERARESLKRTSAPYDLQALRAMQIVAGLAFLRKSHGGCNVPPARCQEPPFESDCLDNKKHPNGVLFILELVAGLEERDRRVIS